MNTAIIAAGGKGVRMNADIRKQYLVLDHIPILTRSVFPFDMCTLIDRIIITVPEEDLNYCRHNIIAPYSFSKKIEIVKGGSERQESVFEGLKAAASSDIVVIHDGVRPFVTPDMIETCIRETGRYGAAIFAMPAFDTLKQANGKNQIIGTIDRKRIWMAQTPQCFDYQLIMEAHKTAKKNGIIGTDDASLVEKIGRQVFIVEGTRYNMKITTPEDLTLARAVLHINNQEI
ncbi:MAG: 2-C-methyl-D-erythritol 4-phosphate cytidylyltransferase [Proteobacteria bacterium]|nr:2-C-methyl-D-erythritol 4-phosphate cytidylyltransferase [Pseudomonadota bacterium]